MDNQEVALKLSNAEALVLFDLVGKLAESSELDPSEQRILARVEGLLEKQLVEVFSPNYKALVNSAKRLLINPDG